MGTVTASTSSILLVMREDLEDKQVAPSVVYVESGISIGTRTGGGALGEASAGAIRGCGPISRGVNWSKR